MASYTLDDTAAAQKFSDTNDKIRKLRKIMEKHPHLGSWFEYEIRDATHDDYYVPQSLSHAAKVMTVKVSEELCKQFSCTPVKESEPCKPNEKASYYYVGDDSYDVQCQPACFNTKTTPTFTQNGKQSVQTPQLSWNKLSNECRIVNTPMVAWLEKTFYRSTTVYELRVNDMPTGYSRIPSDNPYGAGFTYRNNKTYCEYYDRTLQDDFSCDLTSWEKVSDAIVGQTFINTIKSGIRMLTNEGVPFKLPQNLPRLPTELKTEHTLDGWRKHINEAFVVPDLIDTKPRLNGTYRMKRSTDSCSPQPTDPKHERRRKAEQHQPNMSNFMRTAMNLPMDLSTDKVIGIDENGVVMPPRLKRPTHILNGNGKSGEQIDESDDKEMQDWTDQMKAFFISLLKMFTEGRTYANIAIDLTTQLALKKVRSLCLRLVERLSVFLARGMVDIAGSIGTRVFLTAIQSLVVHVMGNLVLRIGAKIAIVIAQILAAAVSVVSWILVATMILDIIFTFWDPVGYNKMFPAELPNDMMKNGELALRREMQVANADLTFEWVCGTLLDEDELMELNLESLFDRIVYLDALVVNSEGSLIEKGKEINLNYGDDSQKTFAQNAAMADRVKFDQQQFEIYNDRFNSRVLTNKYLNYTSAILLLLSGVFFTINTPVLFVVFAILATIVLVVARVELQTDIVTDLIDKYRNKQSLCGGVMGFALS